MKSPEQRSGSNEPPKKKTENKDSILNNNENKEEKLENKITTPEEAAEITKQRRKNFGLEEAQELTQEQTEELEKSIEKLLGDLDQYDFESCSPEIQDEWYWAEQEAIAGKDRELAKANLERLLKLLKEESEKSGK